MGVCLRVFRGDPNNSEPKTWKKQQSIRMMLRGASDGSMIFE